MEKKDFAIQEISTDLDWGCSGEKELFLVPPFPFEHLKHVTWCNAMIDTTYTKMPQFSLPVCSLHVGVDPPAGGPDSHSAQAIELRKYV